MLSLHQHHACAHLQCRQAVSYAAHSAIALTCSIRAPVRRAWLHHWCCQGACNCLVMPYCKAAATAACCNCHRLCQLPDPVVSQQWPHDSRFCQQLSSSAAAEDCAARPAHCCCQPGWGQLLNTGESAAVLLGKLHLQLLQSWLMQALVARCVAAAKLAGCCSCAVWLLLLCCQVAASELADEGLDFAKQLCFDGVWHGSPACRPYVSH